MISGDITTTYVAGSTTTTTADMGMAGMAAAADTG